MNHVIYKLDLCGPTQLSCDINITNMSSGKGLFHFAIQPYTSSVGYRNVNYTGYTTILSDKYDLEYIWLRHTCCTCIVSDLGKLQKLKKLWFQNNTPTSTGSKSDLYDGGKNVTTFSVP